MDQDKPEPTDEDYVRAAGVRHKIGIGCLVVLGGPFLILGLVLLFSGLFGAGETSLLVQLVKLIAGGVLIFGFVALMRKQLNSRKSIEATLRVKHQHPREPWMWREDWAKGESWEIARMKKTGPAKFQMSEVPAQLGGRLRGHVETTLQEIPKDGVSVRFESVTFGVGFHKHSEGQKVSVHCSSDTVIASDELSQGPTGVIVPIDLPISKDGLPYSDRASEEEGRHISSRWRLVVTTRILGVDYRAEFQPPVFDLGEDGLVKEDFEDIAV